MRRKVEHQEREDRGGVDGSAKRGVILDGGASAQIRGQLCVGIDRRRGGERAVDPASHVERGGRGPRLLPVEPREPIATDCHVVAPRVAVHERVRMRIEGFAQRRWIELHRGERGLHCF